MHSHRGSDGVCESRLLTDLTEFFIELTEFFIDLTEFLMGLTVFFMGLTVFWCKGCNGFRPSNARPLTSRISSSNFSFRETAATQHSDDGGKM